MGGIARVSLLCNQAQLRCASGAWERSGDPTEGALLSLALTSGLDDSMERAALPRIDVIPFESEHGFMATFNGCGDAERRVFLEGAQERVLPMCDAARKAGADAALVHADWERAMVAAASQGMRLIAVTVRSVPQGCKQRDMPMLRAGGFTLLGVLAMVDPPRAESVATVQACLGAGIRVKLITGDHAGTASAIGEQLGFPAPVRSLTGDQIETMDDAQLDAALAVTDVFARAAPEHKLRLVDALQRSGDVVVMTGDGVNDAPALKCADVGVAMGHKGTEAAKDAAEMVLADDNFATLAAAVEEDRVVYDNIRKTIVFTLPTNGGEAGILILATVFGLTLPLALAFERPESDVMQRPPRDPREPLVTGLLLWRIGFISVLMVAGCMILYLREMNQGSSLALARTVVVNALVVGHGAYLFNARRLTASALAWEGWTGNRVALAARLVAMVCQMALTYWTPAQSWFGTAPLHWQAWARIGGFGVALLLLVELEKAWRRRPARGKAG